MSNSTLQLALEIALQTKNIKELDLLMDELKAAGIDVTNLTEESAKLAKQFGELEQKQALINQFRELKKATSEANTEWQAAQAATAAYTSQIQDARDSLEALSVAMQNQGEMSAEEASATQAEYNAMVREIRNLEQAQADQATRASQLSSQYDDLNSRLVATRSAMHDVGLSTTGLNAQQQALAQESQAAQQSLAELTNEANRLNEIAQARITLGIDTDDNARRQIEEVTAAYETLRNSGTLTEQELARATQLHAQQVAELENQLGETAPTLETVAEEFGKVTAAAGGLAYVTKAAMDFETAMSGVKKVVDGTPDQMDALSTKIQQMAVAMGMSTDAIAEIAAQGGQLGVPIEKLEQFTEMAGKMSVAFGMTAEDAGDAAAKIANVFGIPIEQVEKLGDAINVLGNTSAAKESEIVDVMQRIGGQAKQFGLATEQAAALSAAFISLGKSPEVAGTAINALLTKLQTANVQGDDFKETLANIGLNANKLADDINANPQAALMNFLKTLESMDKQQRSVATFKLFGQEYVDDVNALVGGLSTYQQALDLVSDKTKTAGAMSKEFDTKMANSAQSIEQAKQSVTVLAQTVGKELLPVVSLGAKAVGGLAQGISDFAEAHPILTKIAVMIASTQVALVAFNSTMKLAGALGARAGIQIAEGAAVATAGLNTATVSATRLNAIMGGIGATAGGIAGIAANLNKVSVGADLAAGNFAKLATQALAVTMAWDAGKAAGNWLYENSEAARSFGDHLAMIPAAIHSIATTGNLDQFHKNFETSAESAKRLANETKSVAKSTEQLAAEQAKAASAVKEQSTANQQLANDIKITEASLESMKNRLSEMETGGQKNTQAYKDLSSEISQTKDKLDLLHAEANKKGIGELLKTDLDKASASFEALGLDAEEFATGINSKTNAALNAFVDIAHLAEGDTRKLALAYNAAKDAAGDNQAAQADLNAKLNQVTEGNTQLAEAVKKTAEEQKNAKSATEEQAAALGKLGISMEAANNGMSKGGKEMVDTLKTGIEAIKQQATSADSLKTSLQQAFATSIASAQTKADFAALQKTIADTGTASQLTAEQTKILNAGIAGGAESAKKAKDEIDKETKALEDNTQASNSDAEAKHKVVDANEKVGDSAVEAGEKSKQSAQEVGQSVQQSVGGMGDALAKMYDNYTASIANGLQSVGITAEQTSAIFKKAMADLSFSQAYVGDWHSFFDAFSRTKAQTAAQIEGFNKIRESTISMTNAIGSASVSVNNLADANLQLYQAQNASVAGIVKMDSATLDNLKRQIASAQQRLDDFAKSAKATADNLKTELARVKGDDTAALEFEQTRKLSELQQRLSEAQKRGNSSELEQIRLAIALQKQLNTEETKKFNAEQAKKVADEKEKAEKKRADEERKATEEQRKLDEARQKQKAELADMTGNNVEAERLKQSQKLLDIENQLADAKESGNAQSVEKLKEMLRLQQKIVDTAVSKVKDKNAENEQKKQAEAEKKQLEEEQKRAEAQRKLVEERQKQQVNLAKSGGDSIEAEHVIQTQKLLDLENRLNETRAKSEIVQQNIAPTHL